MTLEITIPSDTEAQIRTQAVAAGQDAVDFVLQAVAEKLANGESEASLPSRNCDDWADKLRDCIDLHPVATHVVDDSRESIYAGRGE